MFEPCNGLMDGYFGGSSPTSISSKRQNGFFYFEGATVTVPPKYLFN